MLKLGIRPTPNRMLVAECLRACQHPVSMAEIEDMIDTIDKSSVFRVLSLFAEKHLVHAIDDGSGSLKYELCPGGDSHSMEDMHAHFSCEKCGRIKCIEQDVPNINLPDGYKVHSANFVVKGLCPDCS